MLTKGYATLGYSKKITNHIFATVRITMLNYTVIQAFIYSVNFTRYNSDLLYPQKFTRPTQLKVNRINGTESSGKGFQKNPLPLRPFMPILI